MAEGARHRARTLALHALFQMDVGQQPLDDAIRNVLSEENSPSVKEYVGDLTRGVWEQREAIDRLIEAKARNWKLERMARVDRNILRLGAYELLHRPDVPPAVALNEAVELAKEYGDEGSGSFVNGILDSVRATEVKTE